VAVAMSVIEEEGVRVAKAIKAAAVWINCYNLNACTLLVPCSCCCVELIPLDIQGLATWPSLVFEKFSMNISHLSLQFWEGAFPTTQVDLVSLRQEDKSTNPMIGH
jgi:hypothetical protein